MNKIFKYFSPSRIDVLENCIMKASRFQELNDPLEAYPNFSEWRKNAIRVMKPFDHEEQRKSPIIPFKNELSQQVKDAERKLWEGILNIAESVICFTERQDNLLMWAHYAKEFSGFVLGFDSGHYFFSGWEDVGVLMRVEYSRKELFGHRTNET